MKVAVSMLLQKYYYTACISHPSKGMAKLHLFCTQEQSVSFTD